MGTLGEYEYPDITISAAIEIIQIIDEKNIERPEVLANAIGHKGPTAYRGGGFRSKMTALGRYGLLTGKPSELRLSDLAKTIVHHRDENEKLAAIQKAVLSIPILAKIHDKLQGKIPSDFWVPLYDCTGIEQKIVKENADNIRRLYVDAIQYLQYQPETKQDKKLEPSGDKKDDLVEPVPSGLMQFRAGDNANITMPITDENLGLLQNFLETLKKSRKDSPVSDKE